jgi:Flp pilus assembly protein TadD
MPNEVLTAEYYFEQGKTHFYRDYQGAIENYTKAINLKPTDASAYILLASAHFLQSASQFVFGKELLLVESAQFN